MSFILVQFEMERRGTKKMNLTKDKGKQVEEHYDNNPVNPVKPPTDFIAYRYGFIERLLSTFGALN